MIGSGKIAFIPPSFSFSLAPFSSALWLAVFCSARHLLRQGKRTKEKEEEIFALSPSRNGAFFCLKRG